MDQMKYRIEVSVKDRGYCKLCKLYAMFYLYILLKTEKPECSDLNLIKIRFVNPLLYDTLHKALEPRSIKMCDSVWQGSGFANESNFNYIVLEYTED